MVESGLKNRVIIVLVVLSAILFLVAVGSCSNANRQRVSRDKEMLTRLDLEEKLNGFNKEKGDLEDELSKARADLKSQEAAHLATKEELAQEQKVTQELKKELEKITALKDAQEAGLR